MPKPFGPLTLSVLVLGAGEVPVFAQGIVINELMAANRRAVENNGAYPDWVELYNSASTPADVGGYRLSDDPADPAKFVFPANTTIPSLGYLVTWCDDDLSANGLHTGFALDADGATLVLRSPGAAGGVVDQVSFGLQIDDFAIGRVNGVWELTQPTPGGANRAQTVGDVRKLQINEWMAAPSAGEDWFELYNADALPVTLAGLSLSDNQASPNLSPIPTLSFIAPRGFQRFWADRDPARGARHANFKLGQSGEYLGVFGSSVVPLAEVSFGPQTAGVSEGRLPDGTATRTFFPESPSPGASNFLPLRNVIINELLAHTDPPLEDAVEFYNPTDLPVDVSGWYLSNSTADATKYRLPAGSAIGGRGYLVVYEVQFNPLPGLLPGFTFNSAHGDEVVLSAAVGGELTGFRASEVFGASANGVSFGRVETSLGHEFVAQAERTFGNDRPASLAEFRTGTGKPNRGPRIGPVVITEIMYHPPDSAGADNTDDEFLELYNSGDAAVPLYDRLHPDNRWSLAGGVTYKFPRGTELAAGEYLLVIGFDPDKHDARRAAFLARYGLPANARLLGPWNGKLDNGGEAIELYQPDPPQLPPHPDAGYVPQVLVERIAYADAPPWPAGPDGEGASLQRADPTAYGNEPNHWVAAAPTPLAPFGQFAIESVAVAEGVLSLTFTAVPGWTYAVQSQSLVGGGDWFTIQEVPPVSTTQKVTATDALANSGAARFYRVVRR